MSDSNRLEREIEEILGKIEQFPDADQRRRRARSRVGQRAAAAISERLRAGVRWASRFTMSQVMLVSFILILGSLFFRRAAPPVMTWVLYAGIILFVTSFAFLVFTRGGSSTTPNWRGRQVRYQASPTLADRLRRWWSATRTRR